MFKAFGAFRKGTIEDSLYLMEIKIWKLELTYSIPKLDINLIMLLLLLHYGYILQ